MKLCKQATESKCGKNCCCFYCDDQNDCADVCTMYDTQDEAGQCEEAFDEQSALQAFNTSAMEVMKNIAEIDRQKKALDEQDKLVRQALKEQMAAYGIKSFENDILKVTYVAPSTRTSIDAKALKKDHPDIAEKYSKTSNVAASVRIQTK